MKVIIRFLKVDWPLSLLCALIWISLPVKVAANSDTSRGSWQLEHPSTDLQQDLAQLDSFLSHRDLDSLEAVVNRESTKWQERDRASFITYMSKACSLISSYDIGDISKRASLLSRYAISVLMSGGLPLSDHVEFVEFLMLDPPTIDEATWRSLREQKAELWLAARRRVAGSVDPTFNFGD